MPLPEPGYEDKRIYVWFEAVIGYLSAAKEWAALRGQPDAWEPFWSGDARAYYFMGKDNIPFHTIIWPAMLTGYGGLALPYDVPANEFVTLEGRQLSTSRNWAVWVGDYLDRYDPDPLRYHMSATMPETSDSDFSWHDFVRRNNDELVATYGNLVHRTLTLTHRNFQGRVPQPGELEESSREMLAKAGQALAAVDDSLHGCRFRAALGQAMSLAQEANRYIDRREPWRTARTDSQATANTLWVMLSVINCLKTALLPFLPFSSQKLHALLGFSGEAAQGGWQWDCSPESMPPGQALPAPSRLFDKLDDDVAAAEIARLGLSA